MSKVSFDFTDENYIVTGASSGMGRQIALELAEAGANVLAVGRNEERLNEVQAHFPDRIFPARLDVTDDGALETAVKNFVQEHGKLNGGVHAAGISALTPLRGGNTEITRQIMETSFWAGMSLLRLVTKSSYGNKGTSTVLFSSVAAFLPEKGMFAYSAAKSALIAAMRSAAKEICPKGHRVNAIVPGWVKTSMTDNSSEWTNTDEVFGKHLLGTGEPSDVSRVVLFLLSDAAAWITGSSVTVDGGYLA